MRCFTHGRTLERVKRGIIQQQQGVLLDLLRMDSITTSVSERKAIWSTAPCQVRTRSPDDEDRHLKLRRILMRQQTSEYLMSTVSYRWVVEPTTKTLLDLTLDFCCTTCKIEARSMLWRPAECASCITRFHRLSRSLPPGTV
jgi:hypothetical protein